MFQSFGDNGILSKLYQFTPLETCLLVYCTIFLFAFVGQLSRLTVSKEIKIDWVNELQKGCIRLQNFFDIKSLTSALFTKSELLNVKDASMPNKFTVIFDYITGELGAYLMNLKRLLLPITMYAPMKHALLMYLMNL